MRTVAVVALALWFVVLGLGIAHEFLHPHEESPCQLIQCLAAPALPVISPATTPVLVVVSFQPCADRPAGPFVDAPATPHEPRGPPDSLVSI